MAYQWWIIAFLVYWIGGIYLYLIVRYADGWDHRDVHMTIWLGWLVPIILIGAGLFVAIVEPLIRMWHEGWEKYGPDPAMEKEDQ